YQLVVAALHGGGERLHLRFEVATAALVLTLIEVDGRLELPAAFPHGILLAPPGGELIALAPQRLAELTTRLPGDGSLAVLAVGGAALRAAVNQLAGRDGSARSLALDTTLDADPREALGALIKLWLAGRSEGG